MQPKNARLLVLTASLCSALTVAPGAMAAPRTHDGFYLQGALGLGYLSTSAEAQGTSITYSGLSVPSQFLIGGTLGGGFVLGGGFIADYLPSPGVSLSTGGTDMSGTAEDASLYLIGIGPFVDFYPDPTSGLHFQGFAGWGGLEASYRGNVGGSDPTGLVASLGGGYDWWLGSEFSIGVLGRFVFAPLSLNEVGWTTISPGVLATFTYH